MGKVTMTGEWFLESLAPRERETLELVGLFLPNSEIAARMGIAQQSVAKYVRRIYAKAQARMPAGREPLGSRIALLGFLYFHGILECPCAARRAAAARAR